MMKTLMWGASRGGEHGRLSIFIFHRVLGNQDELFPDEPDVIRFNETMAWIKKWFNVIPLNSAVHQLGKKTLPPRAAAITFDDGYADNYTNALPILKQHGLSATFFIATGFLNGGRMWNDTVIESIRACKTSCLDLDHLSLGTLNVGSIEDKRAAIGKVLKSIKYLPRSEREAIVHRIAEVAKATLPTNLMMTSAQIVAMRDAGMQIGAHTVSHPILARTELPVARQEITDGKILLESLLEEKISLFAYPNGKKGEDYLQEHADLIRQLGFDAAVTTDWGAASSNTDLFNIPRFTPWDKSKTRFGLRLINNLLRS